MKSEIAKYNPLWLRHNYLNEDYHAKQLAAMEKVISDCKMPILKFMIKDIHHFEAVLPVISKYRFDYKPAYYYSFPMNELTIYLK